LTSTVLINRGQPSDFAARVYYRVASDDLSPTISGYCNRIAAMNHVARGIFSFFIYSLRNVERIEDAIAHSI
jgi:hypothetical protein